MIGGDELRDLVRCSSVVGSWLLAEARELSDSGRVREANARVEAARLAFGVGTQGWSPQHETLWDRSLASLDALEAELVTQADRIAWLEGEVAGWRIKLAECIEDAGRYCDALEKIAATDGGEWYARSVARAALDGTPSELAECEERHG